MCLIAAETQHFYVFLTFVPPPHTHKYSYIREGVDLVCQKALHLLFAVTVFARRTERGEKEQKDNHYERDSEMHQIGTVSSELHC